MAQMQLKKSLDSDSSGKFGDVRVEQRKTVMKGNNITGFIGECLDRVAWQGKPCLARDLPETAM